MFFVYLLHSIKLERNYVGSTNNLRRRLSQHIKGYSRYTSQSDDWKLKYFKVFDSENEARLYEQRIKSNKKYRLLFYKEAEGVVPV